MITSESGAVAMYASRSPPISIGTANPARDAIRVKACAASQLSFRGARKRPELGMKPETIEI